MDLPKDFYKIVEEKGYLQNVIYGDTDSLFIIIKSDVKDLDDKINLAAKTGKDINSRIEEYLKGTYFKRANISPEYNQTDFKTEIIIDSILFIPDIKKQYAYKTIVKNNKVLEKPKVEYKGIQVVRVDATKLGQRLLREVIENIILNSNVKKEDKIAHVLKAVNDTHNEFLKCIEDAYFEDIGISCKWGKDTSIINSMKIYNFIMGDNTFSASSAGRFIYCKFGNLDLFKSLNIDLKKINSIVIPYNYSSDLVKEKFEEYKIVLDTEMQWGRVFTTTCNRIVELVKMESKSV